MLAVAGDMHKLAGVALAGAGDGAVHTLDRPLQRFGYFHHRHGAVLAQAGQDGVADGWIVMAHA